MKMIFHSARTKDPQARAEHCRGCAACMISSLIALMSLLVVLVSVCQSRMGQM